MLDRGWEIYHGQKPAPAGPVVITGAALGLPGTEHIFDDGNVGRILRGDQFINLIPPELRRAMLDKHITRLVKSENGGAVFEPITDVADVIKLAGRGGAFDLGSEFGVSGRTPRRTGPGDAAGDCCRNRCHARCRHSAGHALQDHDQGHQAARALGIARRPARRHRCDLRLRVPGLRLLRRDHVGILRRPCTPRGAGDAGEMERTDGERTLGLGQEVDRRIDELRATIEQKPYVFDRRFLLRVLSMGHSQFAELIGARGPNTQINAACATTAQAVGLAEDWIRAGRCRRVIVISADDVTSDNMIGWFGAGLPGQRSGSHG